jgi:hypothetical protein
MQSPSPQAFFALIFLQNASLGGPWHPFKCKKRCHLHALTHPLPLSCRPSHAYLRINGEEHYNIYWGCMCNKSLLGLVGRVKDGMCHGMVMGPPPTSCAKVTLCGGPHTKVGLTGHGMAWQHFMQGGVHCHRSHTKMLTTGWGSC